MNKLRAASVLYTNVYKRVAAASSGRAADDTV